MRCPFCGDVDTQVKDSRPSDDGMSIKRRRYCVACSSRFSTLERIQLRELTIVKKTGEKKPFDRDKITRSIKTAVRKRSISEEKIEMLVNNLVKRFESFSDNEILTSVIGDEIMKELSKIDLVATVRFASVYKDFSSAEDFKKFIEQFKINVE